jgi:DMSO/TMAO reductase YedYZ molybdopterin-dependent catalytic subunit
MVVVPGDTLHFSLKHTVEIRVAFDECEKTMHWGKHGEAASSQKAAV